MPLTPKAWSAIVKICKAPHIQQFLQYNLHIATKELDMQHTETLQALALHSKGINIVPADVKSLLANVRGTTFANIVQVTDVKLAAAHKTVSIKKVTEASVQLFNNLSEFTSVYANAVKRSAAKIADNDAALVAQFTAQENWFEHTDTYSLVKHKTKDAYYLYAIYNTAKSVYVMDGTQITKQEVAKYMTPAAARDLLEPYDHNLNVGQDVLHDVQVRVVALANIVSIIAQKQLLIK